MKKKSAPGKASPLSPELESLLREADENTASWAENPGPLVRRLTEFSPEDLETFFVQLLKKEEDQVFPLLEALCGTGEKVDAALAAALGGWNSPLAGILLRRLGSGASSKAVTKAVRKSVFRLKSKGISVEDVEEHAAPVYHVPKAPSPEGYVTAIDSGGNRLVSLAMPRLPQGLMILHMLFNDVDGILQFNAFEGSRRSFHEYIAGFEEEAKTQLVAAPPEYCHGLMEEAAEKNRQIGKALPKEFLEVHPLLGPPPSLPLKPVIYRHVNEEEIKAHPEFLDRAPALFGNPLFSDWVLEEEETRKYTTLVQDASASPLVLSPYQKESRTMDIYVQALQELFPPERRQRYRRRLEETAYVLWQKGQEGEARVSVAAALALGEESRILTPHPFLLELVKRSIDTMLREEEAKRKEEPSLVVKP